MRDVIEMAREVNATAYTNRHYPDRTTYTFGPEQLKAFAELVRADERDRAMRENAYVQAEREACAKVCEARAEEEIGMAYEGIALDCAAAIRARGNT
jgi:hypothetical protein